MASLDELRQEAQQRHRDYPVSLTDGTTVLLRAPLRLSSERRAKVRSMQSNVSALQDDPSYSDADLLELLRDIIRTVVDDPGHGERLINEIGDDLSLLQTMFEQYAEQTQAGEVSHSANS